MKKIAVVLSLLIAGTSIAGPRAEAQMHGQNDGGKGIQDVLGQIPGIEGKTPAELTLGERAALADMFSVLRQEQRYVGKAGVSSFLLPGSGQFMIGEPLKGAAFMLAQAAIIGGTMAGVHYLLPAGYTALMGDPTAMRAYVRSSDRTAFLPAMGVMAGGLTLAIANSVLSSRLAASGARDKIESGKIVFKPNLLYSSAGMGMGFRFVY